MDRLHDSDIDFLICFIFLLKNNKWSTFVLWSSLLFLDEIIFIFDFML